MLRTVYFLLFIIASGVMSTNGQKFNVTGRVSDASADLPIFQLSVVEQNSGIGTITNDKGNYSLFLNAGKVEMLFSGINYDPVKIEFILTRDTLIDVSVNYSLRDRFKRIRRDQSAMVDSNHTSKNDNKPR
jgi:hypothetical protein